MTRAVLIDEAMAEVLIKGICTGFHEGIFAEGDQKVEETIQALRQMFPEVIDRHIVDLADGEVLVVRRAGLQTRREAG